MEQVILQLLTPNTRAPQLVGRKEVAPSANHRTTTLPASFYSPQQDIEQALNAVLPTSQEENKLQKARRILGETAKSQTDEELQTFLTEMQFLIDSWLDGFEKEIFQGMTLKQLLREG